MSRVPRKTKTLYLLLFPLSVASVSAQNPGQQWLRYKTPEQAGWSSERLETICRNANANAMFLVHNGSIVYAYGEYWRRMKCHSMRKSFLGALYGIYVARGMIDTGKTVGQLAVQNNPPLTEQEKKARIVDLLTCRSGIYLPSGQETEEMKRSRPERGSHAPGTFWYYNNWDFNALGTIFRKETGKDIFQAFESDIADPLQMEEFQLMDGVYDFEPPDTCHPGYMFKMSARDAARFGQLFLRNGVWNGKQIVPRDWIERSTTSLAATTAPRTTYGYLWWILENFNGVRMYCAAGHSGQRICVVPSLELVVVLNSDSYSGNSILDVDYVLLDLVFSARIGDAVSRPEFVPLEGPAPLQATALSKNEQHDYVGKYALGDTSVTICETDDGLFLCGYHWSYRFHLLPLSKSEFRVEDIDLLLAVDRDSKGMPTHLQMHKSETTRELFHMIMERGMESAAKEFPSFRGRLRQKEELEFLCDQLERQGISTLPLRELNADCFPYSFKAQSDLKNELLRTEDLNGAARVFRRLLRSVHERRLAGTKTEWFATILDAFASEPRVSKEEERAFAGDYGHRHVEAEGGILYYRSGDSATRRKLHRISDRRFAIEGTYNMCIEFGPDEGGTAKSITGHYYRDSREETYRTK